jgi:hypothetical protein
MPPISIVKIMLGKLFPIEVKLVELIDYLYNTKISIINTTINQILKRFSMMDAIEQHIKNLTLFYHDLNLLSFSIHLNYYYHWIYSI